MESSKMLAGKNEFAQWVISASKSRRSEEYRELYNFLLDIFTRADSKMTGQVTVADFDGMIEDAAQAPRKFGFAPSSAETYRNDAERKAARAAMFNAMDADNSGTISFFEWLSFSYAHICRKAKGLDETLTGQPPKDCPTRMLRSKEDFISFVKGLVASRSGREYKEFYGFLLHCFTTADAAMVGYITPFEFDEMIEIAAEAPRKFGFAPPASETYRSEAERVAARGRMFEAMDTDKEGRVNFSQWMEFCYTHVSEKAKQLP